MNFNIRLSPRRAAGGQCANRHPTSPHDSWGAKTLIGISAIILWCGLADRSAAEDLFPPQFARFEPDAKNPLFTAQGPGHWDVKMRERGWILRDGETWHLWYTGYDGT